MKHLCIAPQVEMVVLILIQDSANVDYGFWLVGWLLVWLTARHNKYVSVG